MYRHTIKENVPGWTIFNWSLLAFLSGSVNAGAFLACSRFVTHLTGFATHFGIDLVEENYVEALGIAVVPVFFIIGSMASALLVDRRITLHKEPRYDIAMLLVAFCMVLAAFGGYFNLFGRFGDVAQIRSDFILLVLLCGGSGVQNAAITSASKGSIRSTHLTGISTDLGIGLVKLYYTNRSDERTWGRRVRAQMIRVLSIGAFIAGSVAGAWLFIHFHYLGFLVPAAIALHVARVAWIEQQGERTNGMY